MYNAYDNYVSELKELEELEENKVKNFVKKHKKKLIAGAGTLAAAGTLYKAGGGKFGDLVGKGAGENWKNHLKQWEQVVKQ